MTIIFFDFLLIEFQLSCLGSSEKYVVKNLLVEFISPKPKFYLIFFVLFSYKIMQDCWQENPDDRPIFENLKNDLKEMENQHQVEYLQSKFKAWSPFDLEVV